MRHDHGLTHVDLEGVETRNRNVFETEWHDFIVARTPVADGGSVVAALAQERGQRDDALLRGLHGFAIRIHLADAMALRVLRGHQLDAGLQGRGD